MALKLYLTRYIIHFSSKTGQHRFLIVNIDLGPFRKDHISKSNCAHYFLQKNTVIKHIYTMHIKTVSI